VSAARWRTIFGADRGKTDAELAGSAGRWSVKLVETA
jgi:hypothetical protein